MKRKRHIDILRKRDKRRKLERKGYYVSRLISIDSQELEKIEEEWEKKKAKLLDTKKQQQQQKEKVKVEKNEDYTEMLPDEIITSCILSRLPMKAAVRTSVLSRRWRNLWKYCISTRLIFFDDIYSHKPCNSHGYPSRRAKKRWASYLQATVKFVDCILKSYPHSTMNDFTLRLPFIQTLSSDVDGWLHFAFRKGIKRIELAPPPDLMMQYRRIIRNYYVFPGVDKLSNWLLNEHVGSSALTNYNNKLTYLQLSYVSINQESIGFILSNCPFLEHLSINFSLRLVGLKVLGPSLRLRYLGIFCCHNLKSVEISAPNLTCFKFHSPYFDRPEFAMCLKYVPRLSEMFIAGTHTSSVIQNFPQHYSYISQLETLTLELSQCTLKESISFPLEFPELNKLKHLEVIMHVFSPFHCLLWPTSLIKAAPFLQRFTAKLRYGPETFISDAVCEHRLGPGYGNLLTPVKERERIQMATDHVHESLKVVELIGFISQPSDLELAHHLLGIAAKSLVKLVLDYKSGSPDMQTITLWKRLPVGAELVTRSIEGS